LTQLGESVKVAAAPRLILPLFRGKNFGYRYNLKLITLLSAEEIPDMATGKEKNGYSGAGKDGAWLRSSNSSPSAPWGGEQWRLKFRQ
jgi:hypothetical protein